MKGYRWYFLKEVPVCLKPDDIIMLKSMEKTVALDSKYISILLSAVYGDDVLKESSAGGKKSNYNDLSHKALDGKKLKFIKGITFFLSISLLYRILHCLCYIVSKTNTPLSYFSLTDLFEQRVLDDEKRKKKFTAIVNKKCNNLRRSINKKK